VEAGEVEGEAAEDGDDGWVEGEAPGGFAEAGEDANAADPAAEFNAEGEGEEHTHGAFVREESDNDGDGDEAVILEAAGEGEGAATLADTESGERGGKPGNGDADGDKREAEEGGDEDRTGGHDGFIADEPVEDEAGGKDGDDDAHHAFVDLLREDFGSPEDGADDHGQVDGEGDGEDGGVGEHSGGGSGARRIGFGLMLE